MEGEGEGKDEEHDLWDTLLVNQSSVRTQDLLV
jgi:hypothetical protein